MNELQIYQWLQNNNAPFSLKLKVIELFQISTLLVEFGLFTIVCDFRMILANKFARFGATHNLSFFSLQTGQLVEKKRSSAFLDGFFSTNYHPPKC